MSESRQTYEVKVITPKNILREKIGYGGIDPVAMDRAEEAVKADVEKTDFQPMARGFLDRIASAISVASRTPVRDKKIIAGISGPIMDMKASAGMLGYPLISEIADVILDFLEGLETMNEDALNIVTVHHKTLTTIISAGLKGDGGAEGYALSKELYGVCQRYYKKYPKEQD